MANAFPDEVEEASERAREKLSEEEKEILEEIHLQLLETDFIDFRVDDRGENP